MLKITIPAMEGFDESTSRFVTLPEKELQLEHSLVSLSKWEAKWKKPFLSKDSMTAEQSIDYIRHMTITQNVDDTVYSRITQSMINEIRKYIDDPMSATTFADLNNNNNKKNTEIITSEIIYYWMVKFNVPFECQKWHLNRLLALIKVCNLKENPPKKMGRKESASKQRALNEARKAKYGTRG